MGVHTEQECLNRIDTIKLDKAAIRTAVYYKGVEIPEGTNLSEYGEYISQISGGAEPDGTTIITNTQGKLAWNTEDLSEEEYQERKEAGTLDENVMYKTPDDAPTPTTNYIEVAEVVDTNKLKLTSNLGVVTNFNVVIPAGMKLGTPVSDWSQLPTTGLTNGLYIINITNHTAKIWIDEATGWVDAGAATIEVDTEISTGSTNPVQNKAIALKIAQFETEFFNMIYPVGSIYISVGANLPVAFKGTWERIEDEYYLVSNSTSQGTYLDAELPNITGRTAQTGGSDIGFNPSSMWMKDGALSFSTGTFNGFNSNSSSSKRVTGFSIDASASNPIYKNGGKVQPKSLVCSMWKRIS